MPGSQRGRRKAARRLTEGPCTYCGAWCDPALPIGHPRKATWDHLIPRSVDPEQGWSRLDLMVRACQPCNSAKGAGTLRPRGGVSNPSRSW